MDTQPAAVVVDLLDGVERREDGARPPDAVVVEHLVADDRALRRDARDRGQGRQLAAHLAVLVALHPHGTERVPAGRRTATRDDAGHVRAVPVRVARRVALRGREVAVGQPRAVEVVELLEVGVLGVDAGVEHGPADVLPERGVGGVGGIRLDRGDRAVEQGLDLEVGPDPEDRLAVRRVGPGQGDDDLRLEPAQEVGPADHRVSHALGHRGFTGRLARCLDQSEGELGGGRPVRGELEVEVEHDGDGGVVTRVGGRPDPLEQRDRDDGAVQGTGVVATRLVVDGLVHVPTPLSAGAAYSGEEAPPPGGDTSRRATRHPSPGGVSPGRRGAPDRRGHASRACGTG